jgi:hypothetical protein
MILKKREKKKKKKREYTREKKATMGKKKIIKSVARNKVHSHIRIMKSQHIIV